jgi:hypothetical protein
MSKRLFYLLPTDEGRRTMVYRLSSIVRRPYSRALVAATLLPLALLALVWVLANIGQNKPPAVMDARVKPVVPLGTWGDVVSFPIVTLGFHGSESQTGPLYLKRAVAAGYPANGKVYILGGKHRPDGADIGVRWIWEYNPANNTLVQKGAQLDVDQNGSRYTGNMAVGVLTDTNGPRIYLVGGSTINGMVTGAVRVYDPNTDTLTTSDNWPANPPRVPGGYAVYNNKLYIFGGHQIEPTSQLFSDTWVFDPTLPQGQRWSQITSANLSVPRAYIAAAELDGYIYAIGGDEVISNTATPLPIVERMDPGQPSPTWQQVASLPWPRGDMGAWAYDTGSPYEIAGRIVVAGGGYPVPDTAALIYNPGTNAWTTFPDMLRPRRNYATAQLNGILYAWGGYDVQGNLYNGSNTSMAYNASGPPPPPAITPSPTPSPEPTSCTAKANYTYTVSTGQTLDPGTTFLPGTNCETCVVNLPLPFPVQLYGRSFDTAVVGTTGNIQFGSDDTMWINRPLPQSGFSYSLFPLWDDLNLSSGGIYTSTVGNAPNRIFNVEWRGTSHDFEVRLFEDSGRIEYVYGTGAGGTATIGVEKDTNYFTQVGYNVPQPVAGTKYTWTTVTCGTPTPTVTGTPPTNTPTRSPTNTPTITPTPVTPTPYAFCPSMGATIVPGTIDTGNHCDDCLTTISLPFAFRLYDQTFTSAQVSSNGQVDFGTADSNFSNSCLPDTAATYAIFPLWDDLYTVNSGYGIFTSISGTAPNRIFNIEWRDQYFPGTGTANFEVRLHENPNTAGEIIYGQVDDQGAGATVGIQRGSGDGNFTQYECNTGGLTPGLMLAFGGACGTPTSTPIPTSPPTSTRTNTPTNTPTNMPTNTSTPVAPTNTLPPSTETATVTGATATGTTPPAPTDTPAPPSPTGVAATPTACSIQFSDVPPGSTFYDFIHCLACNGIVSGYSDGTFKPNATITRGQLSKIVSNSAGFNDSPGPQSFQDVPPGSTFYDFIYRLASRGLISGYRCGGQGEPCMPPGNMPYFRPDNNSTRGQAAKIVSNAAGFNETATGQQFQDVRPGSAFYAYVYRLASRGLISGYRCGGGVPAGSEPCMPPDNLPYYRPDNNASRGQTSKIVAGTFMQNCALTDK